VAGLTTRHTPLSGEEHDRGLLNRSVQELLREKGTPDQAKRKSKKSLRQGRLLEERAKRKEKDILMNRLCP